MERLYSFNEAAEILGVSHDQLRDLARQGEINSVSEDGKLMYMKCGPLFREADVLKKAKKLGKDVYLHGKQETPPEEGSSDTRKLLGGADSRLEEMESGFSSYLSRAPQKADLEKLPEIMEMLSQYARDEFPALRRYMEEIRASLLQLHGKIEADSSPVAEKIKGEIQEAGRAIEKRLGSLEGQAVQALQKYEQYFQDIISALRGSATASNLAVLEADIKKGLEENIAGYGADLSRLRENDEKTLSLLSELQVSAVEIRDALEKIGLMRSWLKEDILGLQKASQAWGQYHQKSRLD